MFGAIKNYKVLKKVLLASTAGLLVFLFIHLSPVKWYAYGENDKYVNLKMVNKDTFIVAGPWSNKNIVQAIYNSNAIADHLEKAGVDFVWLIPLSQQGSVETAQLLKRKYNLKAKIFFAPDPLWKHIFSEDTAETPVKTFLIKNGKQKEVVTGVENWFSTEGISKINKVFDKDLKLI